MVKCKISIVGRDKSELAPFLCSLLLPVGNELRFGLRSFVFRVALIWPVPVLGICETLSDINAECVGVSIAQTDQLTHIRLSIV